MARVPVRGAGEGAGEEHYDCAKGYEQEVCVIGRRFACTPAGELYDDSAKGLA